MEEELEQKVAEFREELAKIRVGMTREDKLSANLIGCVSCQDFYPKKISQLTGGNCVACYQEIEFGIIIDDPSTHRGYGKYSPSEDDDPMVHNCIRILEGD